MRAARAWNRGMGRHGCQEGCLSQKNGLVGLTKTPSQHEGLTVTDGLAPQISSKGEKKQNCPIYRHFRCRGHSFEAHARILPLEQCPPTSSYLGRYIGSEHSTQSSPSASILSIPEHESLTRWISRGFLVSSPPPILKTQLYSFLFVVLSAVRQP